MRSKKKYKAPDPSMLSSPCNEPEDPSETQGRTPAMDLDVGNGPADQTLSSDSTGAGTSGAKGPPDNSGAPRPVKNYKTPRPIPAAFDGSGPRATSAPIGHSPGQVDATGTPVPAPEPIQVHDEFLGIPGGGGASMPSRPGQSGGAESTGAQTKVPVRFPFPPLGSSWAPTFEYRGAAVDVCELFAEDTNASATGQTVVRRSDIRDAELAAARRILDKAWLESVMRRERGEGGAVEQPGGRVMGLETEAAVRYWWMAWQRVAKVKPVGLFKCIPVLVSFPRPDKILRTERPRLLTTRDDFVCQYEIVNAYNSEELIEKLGDRFFPTIQDDLFRDVNYVSQRLQRFFWSLKYMSSHVHHCFKGREVSHLKVNDWIALLIQADSFARSAVRPNIDTSAEVTEERASTVGKEDDGTEMYDFSPYTELQGGEFRDFYFAHEDLSEYNFYDPGDTASFPSDIPILRIDSENASIPADRFHAIYWGQGALKVFWEDEFFCIDVVQLRTPPSWATIHGQFSTFLDSHVIRTKIPFKSVVEVASRSAGATGVVAMTFRLAHAPLYYKRRQHSRTASCLKWTKHKRDVDPSKPFELVLTVCDPALGPVNAEADKDASSGNEQDPFSLLESTQAKASSAETKAGRYEPERNLNTLADLMVVLRLTHRCPESRKRRCYPLRSLWARSVPCVPWSYSPGDAGKVPGPRKPGVRSEESDSSQLPNPYVTSVLLQRMARPHMVQLLMMSVRYLQDRLRRAASTIVVAPHLARFPMDVKSAAQLQPARELVVFSFDREKLEFYLKVKDEEGLAAEMHRVLKRTYTVPGEETTVVVSDNLEDLKLEKGIKLDFNKGPEGSSSSDGAKSMEMFVSRALLWGAPGGRHLVQTEEDILQCHGCQVTYPRGDIGVTPGCDRYFCSIDCRLYPGHGTGMDER